MSTRGDSGDRVTVEILKKSIAVDKDVEESKVIVDSFDFTRGSGVCDNFASDIKSIVVKAQVDGKPADLNYIAKVKPTDKMRMDLLGEVNYNQSMLRLLRACSEHFRSKCNIAYYYI